MTRRSGDRVRGRRAYGGVLVIPCRLNFLERFRPTFEFKKAVLVLRRIGQGKRKQMR